MNKVSKARSLIRVLKQRYNFQCKRSNPFEILVACILSQRTRGVNTEKAVKKLFSKAKTPTQILRLESGEIERLIKSTGFYRQKAKRIKQICRILIERHNSKVPNERDKLLELPGVGFKTADVVLCYGFGIPTIPIDTHCNRISKRIGLVDEKANLEMVRKELEKIVPIKYRHIVNMGLVRFGQETCRPIKPRCDSCPLKRSCNYFRIYQMK